MERIKDNYIRKLSLCLGYGSGEETHGKVGEKLISKLTSIACKSIIHRGAIF